MIMYRVFVNFMFILVSYCFCFWLGLRTIEYLIELVKLLGTVVIILGIGKLYERT